VFLENLNSNDFPGLQKLQQKMQIQIQELLVQITNEVSQQLLVDEESSIVNQDNTLLSFETTPHQRICEFNNYHDDFTSNYKAPPWNNTSDGISNATSNYLTTKNLSQIEPFNPNNYEIHPVEWDSPRTSFCPSTISNNLVSPKNEFSRLNLPVSFSPRNNNTSNSQRHPVSFTSLANQNKTADKSRTAHDSTNIPVMQLRRFSSHEKSKLNVPAFENAPDTSINLMQPSRRYTSTSHSLSSVSGAMSGRLSVT
jgi:hypothetical protein